MQPHRGSLLYLPPEVIARILHFTQAASSAVTYPQATDSHWINYNHAWPRCMLVCRYFRDVALATPRLWAVVVYCEDSAPLTRWAALCAARARDAPLVISTTFRRRSDSRHRLPDDCWARANKIEAFVFSTDHGVFNVRRPHLRALRYNTYKDTPAKLLGGHSSALTSLRLWCARITAAPLLPALLELSFTMCKDGPVPYDVSELVKLLRGAPLLEVLDLRIHAPLGGAAAPLPRLALAHLKTASLSMHPSLMTAFTRALPPPRAKLAVELWEMPKAEGEVYDYVSAFWRGIGSSDDPLRVWVFVSNTNFQLVIGAQDADPSDPATLPFMPLSRPQSSPLVEGLFLSGNCAAFDIAALGQVQSCLQHINADGVHGPDDLPSGLDAWARQRAREGRALQTIRFTGLDQYGGALREYARVWDRDGVAGSIVFVGHSS
jgi:hypothetical protein